MITVSCRDFEGLCQAQLDTRQAASPALDEALAAHAAACPGCRAIARRYRTLRAALAAWGPSPSPPAGLAARILAAHRAEARAARGRSVHLSGAARWSAAAAVLLLALGAYALRKRPQPGPAPDPQQPLARSVVPLGRPSVAPSPLTTALSELTAATLELALETSAPAARVGRGMLASAAIPREEEPVTPDESEAPSRLLDTVGDGLNRSMRPLSSSARQAFGFLLPSSRGG